MEKLKNGINGQIHEKNRFGFRKLSVGLTTVF
ncbi:YSIRK-type signal peptide-containing protein [Lactobacillus acidophilus]